MEGAQKVCWNSVRDVRCLLLLIPINYSRGENLLVVVFVAKEFPTAAFLIC